MKPMHIVFIHGANATRDSWNFISSYLVGHKKTFVEYKSQDGFANNLAEMLSVLKDQKNLFIVAHSLGGIYALHLHKQLGEAVKGVVTLSTPYGGSKSADLMKHIFPDYTLLREIGPRAAPIQQGHEVQIACPWTAVISTSGNSFMIPAELNDGVVTLRSMNSRDDVKKIETDCNHYEILVRAQTVDIIQQAFNEILPVTKA